jgi:hypothetical protein
MATSRRRRTTSPSDGPAPRPGAVGTRCGGRVPPPRDPLPSAASGRTSTTRPEEVSGARRTSTAVRPVRKRCRAGWGHPRRTWERCKERCTRWKAETASAVRPSRQRRTAPGTSTTAHTTTSSPTSRMATTPSLGSRLDTLRTPAPSVVDPASGARRFSPPDPAHATGPAPYPTSGPVRPRYPGRRVRLADASEHPDGGLAGSSPGQHPPPGPLGPLDPPSPHPPACGHPSRRAHPGRRGAQLRPRRRPGRCLPAGTHPPASQRRRSRATTRGPLPAREPVVGRGHDPGGTGPLPPVRRHPAAGYSGPRFGALPGPDPPGYRAGHRDQLPVGNRPIGNRPGPRRFEHRTVRRHFGDRPLSVPVNDHSCFDRFDRFGGRHGDGNGERPTGLPKRLAHGPRQPA